MKKVALLSSLILLSGCFDDTSDLQAHISQVQANTVAYIEPMPEVPVFDHFDYSVSELRSPLAITVMSGLVVSTVLTLVVIPVLYSLLNRGDIKLKQTDDVNSIDSAEVS